MQNLKMEFNNLLTLPYSTMKGKLFSKDVITFDEIVQIDALSGQTQMQKLLQIVLTSLRNNQAAKYKGFLQAMEESDDILLQMKAKELGEWISGLPYVFSIQVASYEPGAAPPVRLVRFSPDHFAKLYCKKH